MQPTSHIPRPDFVAGQRVGVYGGSFDPVHLGHVETVLAAQAAADLDSVLYLPTAYPPHKQGSEQVSIEDRLQMVRLALNGHPQLLVGDDEISDEKTFTVNTLKNLNEEFREVEFVLVIGADSYAELNSWRAWEEIVAGWDIVVLPRPGWPFGPNTAPAAVAEVLQQNPVRRHSLLEEPMHPASSTKIRDLLQAGGEAPEGWLSTPVLSYIREHGLYSQALSAAQEPSPSESLPISAADPTPATDSAADPTPADTSAAEPDRPEILPLPKEVAFAAATALDRQAVDLRVLQVGAVCDFADYFIVCSGNSDRQVGAIAHAIQRKLRAVGEKPLHVEGERRASWVLLDYGHFIVHVFDPQTRDFYRLERLWSDAPRVPHQLFGSADVEAYSAGEDREDGDSSEDSSEDSDSEE